MIGEHGDPETWTTEECDRYLAARPKLRELVEELEDLRLYGRERRRLKRAMIEAFRLAEGTLDR